MRTILPLLLASLVAGGGAWAEPAFPPYASDDFVPSVTEAATGFFRVVRRADGKWWAIDPLGRGTFLRGIDHITYGGHWCAFTKRSPYHEANKVRFPDKRDWEDDTIGKLRAWGFNALGAGCDPTLGRGGLIRTGFVSIGEGFCRTTAGGWTETFICPFENTPCSAFPNVFHPKFAAWCDEQARRRCAAGKDDPWVFGHFIDNELAWWGRTLPADSGTGLFDAVTKLPAEHSARVAQQTFMAERGRDVGTATAADKLDFLRLAAEIYFRESTTAIRRHDPNHLVLGARFAGMDGAHPVVWETAGRYCDAVTFNCYPWADLERGIVWTARPPLGEPIDAAFARLHGLVKKPLIVTEWSFPALDSGLPCQYGAGQRVRTQDVRVRATELFARTMLASPYFIGYDYFMWVDQPPEGFNTAFRENTNYGLLTNAGEPYAGLTEMFARLHREIGPARAAASPVASAGEPGATRSASRFLAACFPKPTAEGLVRRTTDDGALVVSNRAGLALTCRPGDAAVFRDVRLKGVTIGSFGGLVRVRRPDGALAWHAVETTTSAAWRVKDGWPVLETAGTGAAGETAYAVDQEFIVHPFRPWVFCRLVRVRNVGTAPLVLNGWFFRQKPAFESEDPLAVRRAPNLYASALCAAWIEAEGTRFWGGLSFAASAERFNYFLGNGRAPFPDAIFAPQGGVRTFATEEAKGAPTAIWYNAPGTCTLAPGAAWEPGDDAWMLAVCGDDGRAGWSRLVRAFERRALGLGTEPDEGGRTKQD